MLKKLLKYDIKSFSNTLLPIYGLTILLALLARIFIFLNDKTPIFRTPMTLVTGLALVLSIAIMFITYIIGIDKFNKQITKDEGYLTHTLPAKKQTIIGSKLITQILFQIASFITALFSICIIGNIKIKEIKYAIETLMKYFSQYKLTTPILIMLVIFMTYIVITLLVYTAISLGQKHSTNKTKIAVLYGIILYIAQQIITSTIFLPLIKNKTIIEELEKTLPKESVLDLSLTISLIVLIITSVLYYFLTTKILEKKLNLE